MLLGLVAACGGSDAATPDEDRPFSPSFGSGDGGTGSNEGGAPGECSEETKDIYVISDQSALYQFHPPTLAFTPKGVLRCPAGGEPTSMAVDRRGVAWVRYSDGTIWNVDTQTLACSETKFGQRVESDDFYKFGMGFSSVSNGSSDEQLFLSDNGGKGLAKLDGSTLNLQVVGPYTGELAGRASELTGTGDGKLYGFFVTTPAQVAEISKSTGEILSTKALPDVYAGRAWAFSFYAGDFYIYTQSLGSGGGPPRAGNGGSDVTRYRPSDGSVAIVKPKIGFTIVGAGVSTCAPVEGPK